MDSYTEMTFAYHHARCSEIKQLKFAEGNNKEKVDFAKSVAGQLIREYTYEFL